MFISFKAATKALNVKIMENQSNSIRILLMVSFIGKNFLQPEASKVNSVSLTFTQCF